MEPSPAAIADISRYHSPFRYPGGKRRLSPQIAGMIGSTGGARLYVEPFCGGASVACALLKHDLVEAVVLNDRHGPVANFWKVLFSARCEELVERTGRCVTPTLAEWNGYMEEGSTGDGVEDAFRFLFLNRTSFSGIVNKNVGPIGGKEQKSSYPISCRWNMPDIIKRLRALSVHGHRVAWVGAGGWEDVSCTVDDISMRMGMNPNDAFWYFDPPYFKKADKIYGHWFESDEHALLKRALDDMDATVRWVLSYDLVPEAEAMWSRHPGYSTDAFATFYFMGRWRTKEKTMKRNEVLVSSGRLVNELKEVKGI